MNRSLCCLAMFLALLGANSGCGPADPPPGPVAQNTPSPVTEPLPPENPPLIVPALPVIPIPEFPPAAPSEPHRPMSPPQPLPPEQPAGPGPMIVVPPQPAVPNPNPAVPNPEPAPMPNPEPGKPPKYPDIIGGRKLEEWITEALRHKDPQYREAALRVLPLFGPDARKPIIGPLCEIMQNKDTDPGLRVAAITIVANLGFDFRVDNNKATPEEKRKMAELRRESKRVIGALMAVMADTLRGSFLRLYCVQTMATFGTDAQGAVGSSGSSSPGTLRAMATDSAWTTRQAVAQTLGIVGVGADKEGNPDPKANPHDPSTDILLNILLKDNCAAVRLAAVQSLLTLGPPKVKDGADYVKAVEKYLKPVALRIDPITPGAKILEDDYSVMVWLWLLQISYDRDKLADNLKKIAHQVKEPSEKDRREKEPGVRLQALYALTALGPLAAPAMPTLREALDRYDDPAIVAATLTAIAAVGTKGGQDALPELIKVRDGSKDEKKPENAPKDWKPDPTLRLLATDAIEVVTGKKKLVDVKEEFEEKKKDEPKK